MPTGNQGGCRCCCGHSTDVNKWSTWMYVVGVITLIFGLSIIGFDCWAFIAANALILRICWKWFLWVILGYGSLVFANAVTGIYGTCVAKKLKIKDKSNGALITYTITTKLLFFVHVLFILAILFVLDVVENPKLTDVLDKDGLPPGSVQVKFDYAVKTSLTANKADWIQIQDHFQCCGWNFHDLKERTNLASGKYCLQPLPPTIKNGKKVDGGHIRPVLPCKLILTNETKSQIWWILLVISGATMLMVLGFLAAFCLCCCAKPQDFYDAMPEEDNIPIWH